MASKFLEKLTPRRLLRWALWLIAFLFLIPIVSEFFIEWAREQGLYSQPSAKVGTLVDLLPSILDRPYFPWIVGALSAALALLLDSWLRNNERRQPPAGMQSAAPVVLTEVRNRIFRDETVVLDGHRYVSCTFTRVTLQWNGGKFTVDDPKWEGGYNFVTTNALISDTMDILRWLKMTDEKTQFVKARLPTNKTPPT
jgi:hypothetical protein